MELGILVLEVASGADGNSSIFVIMNWDVLKDTRNQDDLILNPTTAKLVERQSDLFLFVFFILDDKDEMYHALSPPGEYSSQGVHVILLTTCENNNQQSSLSIPSNFKS